MAKNIVVASMRSSSGKTGIIVGLMKTLGKNVGYMKPFGDRLLYQKKRLWDYDSALVTNLFDLEDKPEDITIGFEHSKLKYMFIDEESINEKLLEIVNTTGSNKDVLFIEGGKDISYGVSVNLDPIAITRATNGKLIIVVSGNDESVIIDDIAFVKKYIDTSDVDLLGVIINQIRDVQEFQDTYLNEIENLGIKILGIIPYKNALTTVTMEYVSHVLFAKVLTGEKGMSNTVKHIFVGAMSANAAQRTPAFERQGKLIITSGDRTDLILASLETDTAGIVLTNDILPPSNIISQATSKGIPLLLVPRDTFAVAKMIDDMERLMTRHDTEKIEMFAELVKENVNLDLIFEK